MSAHTKGRIAYPKERYLYVSSLEILSIPNFEPKDWIDCLRPADRLGWRLDLHHPKANMVLGLIERAVISIEALNLKLETMKINASRTWLCDRCGMTGTGAILEREHSDACEALRAMKPQAMDEWTLKCDECDSAQFEGPNSLKAHKIVRHPLGEKDIVRRSAGDRIGLLLQGRYVCDSCPMAFSWAIELRDHWEKVHGHHDEHDHTPTGMCLLFSRQSVTQTPQGQSVLSDLRDSKLSAPSSNPVVTIVGPLSKGI